MNFTQLQLLLQNDELHYISDSTQFFIDNHINPFRPIKTPQKQSTYTSHTAQCY